MNIKNFTIEDLRKLIRNADDSYTNQIRIDKNGSIIMYSAKPEEYIPDNKNYRLKSDAFQAGNGYVGEIAAKDDKYIKNLYEAIMEGWENGDDLVGID